MRCPLGATPDCKVHKWYNELVLLRALIQDCGLNEEIKWGVPCYTFQNKNILLLGAMNNYCCISFLKGSLLSEKAFLQKPGPNSQAARLIKFTSISEIEKIKDDIIECIYEAIEIEKAGLKVNFKSNLEAIPEELQQRFDNDPVFKSAFYSLTPGRQRGYIINISKAKQSQTRIKRIEKYTPMILSGIGLNDKYRSRKT